jgi:hypothetical protein
MRCRLGTGRECAASEALEGGLAACMAQPLCVSGLPSRTRRAARTRETYMAVLRPWFGFINEHGYQWNAGPEAVREYTRLFLIEAGCAFRAGRVDGWFIEATNGPVNQ